MNGKKSRIGKTEVVKLSDLPAPDYVSQDSILLLVQNNQSYKLPVSTIQQDFKSRLDVIYNARFDDIDDSIDKLNESLLSTTYSTHSDICALSTAVNASLPYSISQVSANCDLKINTNNAIIFNQLSTLNAKISDIKIQQLKTFLTMLKTNLENLTEQEKTDISVANAAIVDNSNRIDETKSSLSQKIQKLQNNIVKKLIPELKTRYSELSSALVKLEDQTDKKFTTIDNQFKSVDSNIVNLRSDAFHAMDSMSSSQKKVNSKLSNAIDVSIISAKNMMTRLSSELTSYSNELHDDSIEKIDNLSESCLVKDEALSDAITQNSLLLSSINDNLSKHPLKELSTKIDYAQEDLEKLDVRLYGLTEQIQQDGKTTLDVVSIGDISKLSIAIFEMSVDISCMNKRLDDISSRLHVLRTIESEKYTLSSKETKQVRINIHPDNLPSTFVPMQVANIHFDDFADDEIVLKDKFIDTWSTAVLVITNSTDIVQQFNIKVDVLYANLSC